MVLLSIYSKIFDHTKEAANKTKLSLVLFIAAVVHFTFCILASLSVLSQVVFRGAMITQILSGTFYGLQMYGLLIVLIIRMYDIFQDTQFKLSQCTITLYKLLFALAFIMITFIVPVILTTNPQLIWTIFAFMLVVAIIMNLSLSFMFIYKLMKFNKHCQSYAVHNHRNDKNHMNPYDGALFPVITKNTILAVISNMMTLLVIGGFLISLFANDPDNYIIFGINVIVQELDCYTNFVCIALTFQCFEDTYQRFCGCLDRRFRKCLKCTNESNVNVATPTEEETSESSLTASNLIPTSNTNSCSDQQTMDNYNYNQTGTQLRISSSKLSTTTVNVSGNKDLKYNKDNLDGVKNANSTDEDLINITMPHTSIYWHFGICFGIFICQLSIFIFVLVWLLRQIINDSNG